MTYLNRRKNWLNRRVRRRAKWHSFVWLLCLNSYETALLNEGEYDYVQQVM